MNRKLWYELTPAYRHRLRMNGIGPVDHDSYQPVSLQAARGHLFTPEHGEYPFSITYQSGNGRDITLTRNASEA